MSANEPPCILCGSQASDVREHVKSERIWRVLEEQFGSCFDASERGRLIPAEEVTLRHCQDCGLEFFVPTIPGDGFFYERLSQAGKYYVADKWDFGAALRLKGPAKSLLDLACGGGRFLQLAEQAGLSAIGLDTNPDAVGRARSLGLDVHQNTAAAFADESGAKVDLVTAFQVIEHVADPCGFTRDAARCLKPGGWLIITVPNRRRLFKEPFEVLDGPPHHLSRWAPEQLRTLAERCGLELETLQMEPAPMWACRAALRRIVGGENADGFLARAVGWALFNPITYGFLARTGLAPHLGMTGMSLLAVMRRP